MARRDNYNFHNKKFDSLWVAQFEELSYVGGSYSNPESLTHKVCTMYPALLEDKTQEILGARWRETCKPQKGRKAKIRTTLFEGMAILLYMRNTMNPDEFEDRLDSIEEILRGDV